MLENMRHLVTSSSEGILLHRPVSISTINWYLDTDLKKADHRILFSGRQLAANAELNKAI